MVSWNNCQGFAMHAAAPEGVPPRRETLVFYVYTRVREIDLNSSFQHRTDQVPGNLEGLHLAFRPECILPEKGEHRD